MILGIDTNLTSPILLNQPGMVLELDVDILSSSDVGVLVSAPHCRIIGKGGAIRNCAKSAVMLVDGADDFMIEDVEITGYNQSNTNGNAGIFCMGTVGISKIGVKNCEIHDGNGNGVRLHGCSRVSITGNYIHDTKGQSAEGIAINPYSDRVFIHHNRIERAWTTGILLWGGTHQAVEIKSNDIKNSGQAQDGGHPAIGINPQGATISGISIDKNRCYDDQATPTQTCGLMTYASGTIRCGRVTTDNLGWGMSYPKFWTPANGSTVVFEDWQCQ